MVNIAVFVSGGGTNLQSLIDSIERKEINGEIKLVVSNNPDAFALQRAEKAGISTAICNKKELGAAFEDTLIDILDKNRTFFFITALLELWWFEILTTDTAVFYLNCSTSFDLVCNESSEILVLKYLDYTEKETHCDYSSVYVKNNNSTISNIKFFAENVNKVRNKTIRKRT